MKFFTKKSAAQKIIITLVMVVLVNFSIPKPVQADFGGLLMSPIITFATALLDVVQHGLEKLMLGETSNFMKDISAKQLDSNGEPSGISIDVNQEIDGSFLGWDDVNVPVIQYTPEEIFANRVPALDINFITPSVQTGNKETDEKMNVAIKLRPTIASWYVAIRNLAVVGLLSVLVYLGIRMLLTSIAADRAKYKKMLVDWIVAVCIVITMQYIMSFALTLTETITAMIASDAGKTVLVNVTTGQAFSFNANLMSYVRFMIQCVDFFDKITFFFLYLMLIIYSIRFTWVYLKRVVNMAFLTLMAPLVALTYPIDKVSDGKAQAFNMWLKEFSYNALIQPLHLLLYIVLLSSATELAVNNPLYAIVCLGFIIAAEKLLKKMFGFEKASGGTLGSLAGAAGVSTLANQGLNMLYKNKTGNNNSGKVRTKDSLERTGRDNKANKDFNSFEKTGALVEPEEDPNEAVSPPPDDDAAGSGNNDGNNGEALDQGSDGQGSDGQGSNGQGPGDGESPGGDSGVQNNDIGESGQQPNTDDLINKDAAAQELKRLHAISTRKPPNKVGRTLKGIAAGGGTLAYKAARGTAKTAARALFAIPLAATAGVIGATLGDGEKALAMAGAAFTGGASLGAGLFESGARSKLPDRSIRRSYDKAKYGNAIDARNKRADKAYIKSEAFDDYYSKNFSNKYSKKEFTDAVLSYRQSGITDEKTIKKALALEETYGKKYKGQLTQEQIRGDVQNIVQTKDDINTKAFYNETAKQKELKRIESSLNISDEKQRSAVARRIFKGYEDFRSIT